MEGGSRLNRDLIASLRHLLRESRRLVEYLRRYSGAEEVRRAEERHAHLEAIYLRLTGDAIGQELDTSPMIPVTVGLEGSF